MRVFAVVAIVIVNILALVFMWPRGERPPDDARASSEKKVFVLGCDGLDYERIERLLSEGRLPNMARLRDKGGFRPLTTSIPPQSPVAW
ncbi:MAG: alkaline phosphatase family protein, partial [Phycisphaerae bacterium]|nr:alkaline phosphatase family protein [Phycisphaerae bacterium]